jgi:hypothetical protein
MAAVAGAVARRPSRLMAVLLTVQREMEEMVYMVYGETARRGRVVLWRVIGEVRRKPVELAGYPAG